MSEADSPVEMWTPVAEQVWVRTLPADGVPGGVNVGLIAGQTGCVLVDAGATPEQGDALRAAVSEVTDVPLRGMILTHAHWDHVGGLPAFADLPVYAHEACGDLATAPFALGTALDLGDIMAEIVTPGPAHTAADAVVAVGACGVLFVGDLAENPAHPSVEEESTLSGWADALSLVTRLVGPQGVVVPGHGRPMSLDAVAGQAQQLRTILQQTEALLARGVGDAARALALGTWPWEDGEPLHNAIEAALRDLRARGHRPQLPLSTR